MPTGSLAPRRLPWYGWLALALVALVLAAWAVLAAAFPPARVRALIATQLQGALAREVRFGDASVGLWPPVRLTVREPALAEPGGFANGAAFQARSLHLDLDLLALLSRRLVVRRLVLDEPALHLLLHADGSTNLDGIGSPAPPGRPASRPMDLAVRELSIVRGRVLVDDLKSARRTALALETRLSFASERGGERLATDGVTTISDLGFGPLSAARVSDLNRSLARLKWRIEHRGKYDAPSRRLALERLALRLGRAEIVLAGRVDEPGPRARLDFRARGAGVDLGQVLGYLAAADARVLHGIRGAGQLAFDLGVRGALGPRQLPALTGVLSVRDGAFRYPGAPAGVEALTFTARFAPDSLGIGDLSARVAGQPLRAAVVVTRFSDPAVRFALQGDVDLAAVAPLVAPKDTRLAGRAAVDVRGQGRAKDPGSMALEGNARLSGVSVESPALPSRIEQVQGALGFSSSRATVRALSARAGKSSFTLDATVGRPLALLAKPGTVAPAEVDFALESPYLDLAELLPTTPGAPLLPNARGGGRVAIGRLRSQKLDVQDVTARVALEPAVLGVPEFHLKGYGGAVAGDARFDLADPARPAFAVKSRVDSVQADALLSAWTPARNLLHGSLSTDLDLSGQGAAPADLKRTLTAVGLAALANGTFGPGPALEEIARFTRVPAFKEVRFKDLKLPFRVERGRVVTDPVVLDGPNGEWRLSGAVGFDGALDYAVSTTLPPEAVKALGANAALAAGALADAEGRVLIDLRVSGTGLAPKVAWDSRAMRDRLAGRVSQALADERAKLEQELRGAAAAQQQATADSAQAAAGRLRQAVTDSLRKKAGGFLRGFFGTPRDTARK